MTERFATLLLTFARRVAHFISILDSSCAFCRVLQGFFWNCHFDTCVFFYISFFITDLFLDYLLLSSFFPLFKCTYYSCEFRVSDPIDCLTLPMIPASMKTTWSSLRSPLKNNILEFMRPMTAAKRSRSQIMLLLSLLCVAIAIMMLLCLAEELTFQRCRFIIAWLFLVSRLIFFV